MASDVAVGPMLTTELDEALTGLAVARGKSKDALICEVLAEYVAYEKAFVAVVEEGLAALDADDAVPHDQVMREIDELLARKR
jgi:predicted transcriptional regulator